MLLWENLLSIMREREFNNKCEVTNRYSGHRNQFEADYDRIVGSSSVRRLQDKAQVFPLQENDFVRTRLTHSIEVSSIARSLGKAVSIEIKNQKLDPQFKDEYVDEIAAILQTAGLVHDLGNPPFGHYGETIIQDWFKKWFDEFDSVEKKYKNIFKKEAVITELEKNDYIHFDGNVQNIRILSKLQTLNDFYGANFTYATLATLIKYPWASVSKLSGKKGKFGYLQSEKSIIQNIYQMTGLEEGIRHPLTFLLEAADDITFICDDIEDGVKKGVIDWNIEYNKLWNKLSSNGVLDVEFEEIKSKMNHYRLTRKTNFGKNSEGLISEFPDDILSDVRNFRNIVQAKLIFVAKDSFIDNYNSIMSGKYPASSELIKNGIWKDLCEAINDITKTNCYKCKEALTLELVGDKVIRSLLDIFIPSLIFANKEIVNDVRTYEGKLYSLISSNYKYMDSINYDIGTVKNYDELTLYEKIQMCIDFISGMTDSYAVNLYRELIGVQLP